MNKIDLHNYEAYLLDFSEGNLGGELQMELELFLIQHPELNIDLSDLSLMALENEAVHFSNKNSLKKSETDLVSENQFIGYIENQLSTDERLLLEKSCASNSFLLNELTLYNNTIVKADDYVVYKNKASLKRKSKVIWFNFSVTQFAAAASALFLIGLVIFWSGTETKIDNSQLADKTINETFTTEKAIANNLTDPKTATNKVLNIDVNKTSVAHKSIGSNSQLALEPSTVISQNKNTRSDFKDSISNLAINNSDIINNTREIIIAQHSSAVFKENKQLAVEVITENEDETIVLNKQKYGIWTTISRTLKNLNHAGVKSVNGDEQENKENTSYAITLGGISIKHKVGNL